MADIIHEILECCVKFDQHRPHLKVLSNQYASVFLRYCRLLLSSASKSKAQYSSEEIMSLQNTEFATFFIFTKRAN